MSPPAFRRAAPRPIGVLIRMSEWELRRRIEVLEKRLRDLESKVEVIDPDARAGWQAYNAMPDLPRRIASLEELPGKVKDTGNGG